MSSQAVPDSSLTGSGSSSMRKYMVLLGAIVIQLILGTVYGYSIFWAPLSTEVFPAVVTQQQFDAKPAAEQIEADFTIVANADEAKTTKETQKSYLTFAFSICILSFALVMVIAGRVQDIKGPRFPAIVGAILMGTGFLMAGLMNNPIVFYIAHAAMTGVIAIVFLMLFDAVFGKLDSGEMPILKYIPMGIITSVIVASLLLGNRYVGHSGEIDQLLLLWGTIGFMAGAGIGFAYVCPIAALVKWFPDRKGLVSGIAVAGFGFGAYIFKGEHVIGALGFIKNNGIDNFFLVHGLVCLVGVAIGALMLSNPPGTAKKSAIKSSDTNWQDTLKNPSFYIIWFMFFSGAMAGLMVIGILKGFAGDQLVTAAQANADWITTAIAEAKLDMGNKFAEWMATQGSDKAAATAWIVAKGAAAVGWLAIFNAVGRVFWGFTSDRIGRTAAFVVMFVLQAIMMFVLAGLNTELSLAVGASIVGFNFGGNFALFPSATADRFGAKNLGANYGWVFTSYGIAGVVGIAAGKMALVKTGSYTYAFILAGVLCLISAGLAVGLALSKKKATE